MKTVPFDFRKTSKTDQITFLEPLINRAFAMFQAGVIKKNIVRHFTNKGISLEASQNIVEIANVRFDKFRYYAAK